MVAHVDDLVNFQMINQCNLLSNCFLYESSSLYFSFMSFDSFAYVDQLPPDLNCTIHTHTVDDMKNIFDFEAS